MPIWPGYAFYVHDDQDCVERFAWALERFGDRVAAGHERWCLNLRGTAADAVRAHLCYGDLQERIGQALAALRNIDDDLGVKPENKAALRLAESAQGWTVGAILHLLSGEPNDGAAFNIDRAAALAFARATTDQAIALHNHRKAHC